MGHVVGNCDVAYLADRQGELSAWRAGSLASALAGEADGLIQEPLVVLVDGNTASAAELFAANIRDYQKGLLIGTRTFGKGIAQSLFSLPDGSVFRITTERYYSPAYVTPDRSGVLPHLVVDANLADEVALLLCGEPVEEPSGDVLELELAGQTWYVHRETALTEDYAVAFSELLSALPPDTPMTLDGQAVTPEEAAQAWNVACISRWPGDVAGSPYETEINTLAGLGLVFGNEDGDFRPQEELTRAELAAFLSQAMGFWYWESQGTAPLADLSGEEWYAVPVSALYYLGLVEGDENGAFRPDDLVDYQQFLTILTRMAARTDLTVQWYLEDLSADDLERRPPWAMTAGPAPRPPGPRGWASSPPLWRSAPPTTPSHGRRPPPCSTSSWPTAASWSLCPVLTHKKEIRWEPFPRTSVKEDRRPKRRYLP